MLTRIIDFLPGVKPCDSTMVVEFFPAAEGKVRMVVTLSPMHDEQCTCMQLEGFTSHCRSSIDVSAEKSRKTGRGRAPSGFHTGVVLPRNL